MGFRPRRTAARRAGSLAAVRDVAAARALRSRAGRSKREASLSGELRRIQARITGSAGRLPLHAELTVAPFDPDPLPAIALRIEGLDINTLLPAAPATAINAEFKGAVHGTDSVSGILTAVNAHAGTLDQNRLPVRTLTSQATLTRDAIVLERAQLSLGAAGAAAGSAHIDASGIAVDLTTSSLDLHGLHAALRATHLAGTVRLQVESGRQLINADLRQDNMRVHADAAIADGRLTLKQFAAQAAGASLRGSGEIDLADEYAFSARTVLQDFDPARFGRLSRSPNQWRYRRAGASAPGLGRVHPLSASVQQPARPGSRRQGQAHAVRAQRSGHRCGSGRWAAIAGTARQLRTGGRCARLPARRAAACGCARGAGRQPAGRRQARRHSRSTGAGRDPRGYRAQLRCSYRVQRWTAAARIVQADDPSLHLDSKLERPARGDHHPGCARRHRGRHAVAPFRRADRHRHRRGSAGAGPGAATMCSGAFGRERSSASRTAETLRCI